MEMEHFVGNLSPVYKCNPVINHLLYVDDLLVFAKAIASNVLAIKRILGKLKSYSGFAMNEHKLKLYFSKGSSISITFGIQLVWEWQNCLEPI